MNVNSISNLESTASTQQSSTDASSIEQQIEQLEAQLQQVEANESLSEESKEQQIENLEQQIDELEQQKQQASTQNIASTAQSAPVQQVQQSNMATQSSNPKLRYDSYEKQSPTPSAGLYKVEYDQNGNRVIQVEQTSADDTPSKKNLAQQY